jgi:methylenetetrahydrofolate--tRNA-(uracil-5-)-methyltransferase
VGLAIVATGPLTSPALAEDIRRVGGEEHLAFFDAIAPIVHRETIDTDVAWFQSRYDKAGPGGTGADYINCPLDREQYAALIEALLASEKTEFKEWEAATPYFEGCLPIEVMASRGVDTLRFGPMKPVGLTDPRTGRRPHAVVQLRQDNALGTLYNIVGFQTKLKYGEQARVFRMIPGLEASAVRAAGWPASQHLHQQPSPAGSGAEAKGSASHTFRRTDHRLRGLRRERRGWPLAGRFAAAEARASGSAPRRPRRRTEHCSPTSPAGRWPRRSSR